MPDRPPTSPYVDARVRRAEPGGRAAVPAGPRHAAPDVPPAPPRRARPKVLVVLFCAAFLLIGVVLLRSGLASDPWWTQTAAPAWEQASPTLGGTAGQATPSHSAAPTPTATPPPAPPLRLAGAFPADGPGTFAVHGSPGPVLGRAGALRRFQVAVENGVPEDLDAFAATVDATLGDPRSWIAGQRVRLQRVGRGSPHDFTVYLATAATARQLCAAGGIDIRVGGESYTSCRVGDKVIINLARWRLSVPHYADRGVPLAIYRQYVINHEVGHALGNGHQGCPGPGRPAPVMQKQTLGLEGCTANSWPYVGGRHYVGPPV